MVVDNEDKGLTEDGTSLGSDSSSEEINHGNSLSSSDLEVIENLMAEIQGEASTEKFVIFADSIAKVYQKGGKLDSAAYYFGLIAEKAPDPKNWEKAGNAYYEAFGFLWKKSRRKDWAIKHASI